MAARDTGPRDWDERHPGTSGSNSLHVPRGPARRQEPESAPAVAVLQPLNHLPGSGPRLGTHASPSAPQDVSQIPADRPQSRGLLGGATGQVPAGHRG